MVLHRMPSITDYVPIISISFQIHVQIFCYQKYTNSSQDFINILDKRILVPAVKFYRVWSQKPFKY